MHKGVVLTVIAVAALSACEEVSSILPSRLECGGTEAALCQQVARLGIAQMNLAATGPITEASLETLDCARAGKASFHSTWADAEACWRVTVTGERSHGGGVVVLWPNGDLEPFW